MRFRLILLATLILWAGCAVHDGDPVEGIPGAVHRYTETAAVRWHYLESGEGETVVLLHGIPETAWGWRYQIPALAGRYRVIAPDLPGLGLSRTRRDDASFGEVARQVARLLERLQVGRFRLVGHDWGALIAARLASDLSGQVVAYVHVSAPLDSVELVRRPDFRDFTLSPSQVPRFLRDPEVFVRRQFDAGWAGGAAAVPAELLARHVRELRRGGVAEGLARYFRDLDVGPDGRLGDGARADWSRMRFPVSILVGGRDLIVPLELFLDAGDRIPALRTVQIVDGVGHYPQEERPEVLNRLLQQALELP